MAYWGIALSNWGNPFGGIRHAADDRERQGGRSTKAKATGSPTPRESGYIDAVAILLSSSDRDRRSAHRVLDYEAAMGRSSGDNPNDDRSEDLLRAGDRADRVADRQDLRASTAGGRHPRAAVQADAEHPGHRALHHSRLRRAAARRQGARRRAPLRVARAGDAARAAHAVAHLHARRLVEGIDRDQQAVGRSRARRPTAPAKSCTRSTTRPTRTCRSRRTRRPRPSLDHALSVVGGERRHGGRRRRRRTRSRLPRFPRAMRSSAARGPRPRR